AEGQGHERRLDPAVELHRCPSRRAMPPRPPAALAGTRPIVRMAGYRSRVALSGADTVSFGNKRVTARAQGTPPHISGLAPSTGAGSGAGAGAGRPVTGCHGTAAAEGLAVAPPQSGRSAPARAPSDPA